MDGRMNRKMDWQADSRETVAKGDDVVRKIPPRNGSMERGVFSIYRGGTGEMLVTAIHHKTHSLTKPHRAQEKQQELLTAGQLEMITTSINHNHHHASLLL